MTRRVRVGVLFGGRSGEHEVSLRSAWQVIRALDPARYEVVPVAIGKDGRWRTGIDTLHLLEEAQQALQPMPDHGVEVTLPSEPTRPALVPLGAVRARIEAELGFPCFVKPANLGSSVGIAKVHGPGELAAALAEAASFDPRVMIEEAVAAREFECGVLGNDAPEASVVGELVPSHEFYDYADKYVEAGARIVIPAPLPA